jgi:GNAT superfamily N-acetyltransferase
MEIAAWDEFFQAASPAVVRRCGIRTRHLDGAFVQIASGLDILAYNRVVGVGLEQPATEDGIERITAAFAEAGVPRFFIQVSPAAAPDDLAERLLERGFVHYNSWVRLYRSLEAIPEPRADVDIRPLDAAHATDFGALVALAFGWPDALGTIAAQALGRPGWHHFAAFVDGTLAGTGVLFTGRDLAWITFGTTHPDYRNRGIQKALIIHRMEVARTRGCRTVIVETAEQKPDRASPSYLNMIKLGFEVGYVRPNYLLQLS